MLHADKKLSFARACNLTKYTVVKYTLEARLHVCKFIWQRRVLLLLHQNVVDTGFALSPLCAVKLMCAALHLDRQECRTSHPEDDGRLKMLPFNDGFCSLVLCMHVEQHNCASKAYYFSQIQCQAAEEQGTVILKSIIV